MKHMMGRGSLTMIIGELNLFYNFALVYLIGLVVKYLSGLVRVLWAQTCWSLHTHSSVKHTHACTTTYKDTNKEDDITIKNCQSILIQTGTLQNTKIWLGSDSFLVFFGIRIWLLSIIVNKTWNSAGKQQNSKIRIIKI